MIPARFSKPCRYTLVSLVFNYSLSFRGTRNHTRNSTKIEDFDCEGWIEIHPYNINRSYGTLSFLRNSGGMNCIVATDFNPLKKINDSRMSSIGTVHIRSGSTKIADFDCKGRIEIHPYNINRFYGTISSLCNSGGMNCIVATDFNPLKKISDRK